MIRYNKSVIDWFLEQQLVKSRASGQQIGPGPTDRKLLTVNRSLIQGFLDLKKNSKNVDFYS
jgi:hypothetical protein